MNSIKDLAKIIQRVLKSDRYVFVVCSGITGEGKSCFTTKLAQETAKLTGTPFSYDDNLTFSRKELKEYIDGDKDGKGQKPERSCLVADELISMFFKRNWYDSAQIDGIELLNKCRDRHLLITGNIPDFWDLDKGVYSAITFWVHIRKRGIAWVFKQDDNPFTIDKWNRKDNQKIYYRDKTPYKCRGFVTEIMYSDWTPEDKEKYYSVRNEKRKFIDRNVKKYRDPKYMIQRNRLVRFIVDNKLADYKAIAKVLECNQKNIYHIVNIQAVA